MLDDGCGFDTAHTDGNGNGLRNMHKRAALIPAHLHLLRMGRGTAVELSVAAPAPPAASALSAAD